MLRVFKLGCAIGMSHHGCANSNSVFLQAFLPTLNDQGGRDDSGSAAALLRLPVAFREAAFLECADCFAAMIANQQVGNLLCTETIH